MNGRRNHIGSPADYMCHRDARADQAASADPPQRRSVYTGNKVMGRMAKDGEDDRRASPRIRLRRRVTVTLRGTTHDTHTINVSAGGASVEMIAAPDRGARGSIVMPVSEGPPFDFVAEVRWTSVLSTSSPGGTDTRHLVGLQFIEPPADAVRRLSDVLAAEEDDEDDDA
jgi:hypothetical protein